MPSTFLRLAGASSVVSYRTATSVFFPTHSVQLEAENKDLKASIASKREQVLAAASACQGQSDLFSKACFAIQECNNGVQDSGEITEQATL